MEHLTPILDIIRTLRGGNGCPWDRRQTAASMWKCLAEEVYELGDAITDNAPDDISEEFGDVLFQLLFIAEIYREKGTFDLERCIEKTAGKMIRRHPHVYGDEILTDRAALTERWEGIKKAEKREAGRKEPQSALDSVPSGMPSMMRCHKISKSAAKEGFDWDSMEGVLEKAREEWQEFEAALRSGDAAGISEEFGDILFTLVNVARFAGIYPETALAGATSKFEKRYRYMESLLSEREAALKELSREEIDVLWEAAKKHYDR